MPLRGNCIVIKIPVDKRFKNISRGTPMVVSKSGRVRPVGLKKSRMVPFGFWDGDGNVIVSSQCVGIRRKNHAIHS